MSSLGSFPLLLSSSWSYKWKKWFIWTHLSPVIHLNYFEVSKTNYLLSISRYTTSSVVTFFASEFSRSFSEHHVPVSENLNQVLLLMRTLRQKRYWIKTLNSRKFKPKLNGKKICFVLFPVSSFPFLLKKGHFITLSLLQVVLSSSQSGERYSIRSHHKIWFSTPCGEIWPLLSLYSFQYLIPPPLPLPHPSKKAGLCLPLLYLSLFLELLFTWWWWWYIKYAYIMSDQMEYFPKCGVRKSDTDVAGED